MVTDKTIRGGRNGGPVALYTRLGWVLSGPTHDPCQEIASMTNIVTLRIDCNTELDASLKRFWEVESLGIKDHENIEWFSKEIVFKDSRYEVSLPWRMTHPSLPNNFLLSKRRLIGLLHHLRKHPKLLQEYDKIIRQQLNEGIIEQVSISSPVTNEEHYISHHAVIRKDKKIRVVYNASASLP